jgi:probable phosphoglycerate mutase
MSAIMPTRVLLLRHAETADPTVFHGAESDVGLSERGRRQAEAAAPILAAERPMALISSAMRRALDTARPIAAACGLTTRAEAALHERRVGALAGKSTADGVWPTTLQRWLAAETSFAPPGAESFDDMRARGVPVWQRLTAELAGQTLVMVAHGMVCKVLLLTLLPGWSIADWRRLGPVHNVGIHELVGENGAWQAVRLNAVPAAVAALDQSGERGV